jgi:hypothetical protein
MLIHKVLNPKKESTATAGGKEPVNEGAPRETRTRKEYKGENKGEKDTISDVSKVTQPDSDNDKRKRGELHVDASGMVCWEGNRIYIGTEEIGKRAKITMGNTAEERLVTIDSKVVKSIKVGNDNVIVKEPRENKRTVYDGGRIHFDGHALFVSKSERNKDVWVKTIEKDKVYAVFRNKEMTAELTRIDLSTPKDKITTNTNLPLHGSTPGGVQTKRERSDKDEAGIINFGAFEPQTRHVSNAGQINIFGKQVYVGAEHKEKEVIVRELAEEQKSERHFGVFLGGQQLREIGIIEVKIILDKGIREQFTNNSGQISFKGDLVTIGGGFKNERVTMRPIPGEKGFDVFLGDDLLNLIGTIVKGENGKHEYDAKESRLFASPCGNMKVDGQDVRLGLDHAGKAMRIVHEPERGEHVVFEDGEKERPFGKVICKEGTVVGFERYDKAAPVERKAYPGGRIGLYDNDVSLNPSYSGKTVTVAEEEIGKRFTIYKDGSLKEKAMTVTIGDDGDVTQHIECVRDYLGKVPDDIAEKVVSLGPSRFEELKAAREAGGLVSELARKYGFSFEEMHAVCTSAGVHVKGGDTMADIKDILGHFKPHLKVEGIEDGKARLKCNIEDHLGFSRPVDQARLGSVECLECAGSSGSGTSLAELTCKRYAEAITGVSFEKAHPPWLKSERGGQMELDMYSKDLNVAIEMNGPHHYIFVANLHRTKEEVEEWKRSDALKVKQCAEHGKDLIVIPYHEIYDKHRNTVKLRERVYKEFNDRGLARITCENLVYHTYHHGRVYYNFGRKTEKNAVLDNPKLSLKAYLNRVEREVPVGFFKDPGMPRASKQALALPKAEREVIGKELVQRGLVCKDAEVDMNLPRVAREVMAVGGDGGKVHDHVIQRTLLGCKDVVAVEVPVWAKDKSMTGHIDIIRVDKDGDGMPRITIADFKTEDEAEFARFVPQVEAYARMLRSQLGEGGDGVLVECVLFNGDSSWRWEPGVLERIAAADPAAKRLLDGGTKKRNEKRKVNG